MCGGKSVKLEKGWIRGMIGSLFVLLGWRVKTG
jgi:hypothetical protein